MGIFRSRFHFGPLAGTEELGHMEMIAAMVYQLTQNLCMDEIKKQGFADYFVDHTTGVYPVAASGVPFTVAYLQSKGDLITDLHEDLAAEPATSKNKIIELSHFPTDPQTERKQTNEQEKTA